MRATLYSLLLLLFTSSNALAQFGIIDSSFNEDGKATSQLYDAAAYCVAIQSNGKILAGGYKNTSYYNGNDFFLTRYNTDGSLDMNFGNNGFVTTDFGGDRDQATAIAIQKDSKILLAGRRSLDNSIPEDYFAIARYNPDGSSDVNFGSMGKITSEKQHILGEVRSITELDDDKILVGGTVYTRIDESSSDHSLCIAQYHSNGSPDSSFGVNGIMLINFGENRVGGGLFYDPTDILIQHDGKILIGSTLQSSNWPYTFSDILIARINANGTIDSSFGTDGIVITDVNNSFDEFGSFFLLPEGQVIVSGNTSKDDYLYPGNDSIFVMRYESNGNVDRCFGDHGRIIFSYNNKGGSVATSSAHLLTDEILISGYSYTDSSFLLTAINKNGTLDSSFGVDGFTITPFKFGDGNYGDPYNEFAFAYDMDISSDGKIVLAGIYKYKINDDNYNDIALARYYGESVLPITLSSFTATKKQNSVLLNWQTASETNNNYFAIERSNSSSNGFKEIGRVNSKGSSSQAMQYSFEDIAPLNGLNYYRLKQVNKDGSSSTSKIILVDFTKNAIITLYPNPVKDVLNVKGLSGTTTLSVIDVNGKVVATTRTSNNTYNWNMKALPSGNYYLRIETDKKITTIKFIRQ